MNLMLKAALQYAELGYPVFPCAPGTKDPITEHGFKNATTDAVKIETWWHERPNANIGIATKGLLVLDVDAKSTWLADEPERLMELAVGPLSLTASSGRHYVFRQPADREWRNTTSKIAKGVDTRADGGYFVAPPSALPDGKAYRWAEGLQLDVPPSDLPEPPAWLVELLDELAARGSTWAQDAVSSKIPEGQRNATLARLAGTMRRVGMSGAEILAALRQTNSDRCVPPLDDREVERIAASVARYEPDQVSVALVEDHWGQMATECQELCFKGITSKELAENDYRLTYLIDGLLVRGQPGVIAGPKKSLKTTTIIDLALSLSHAGLFLGRFNVPEPVRVGVMSGESGAATIQETAMRIADAKGEHLQCFENVVWCFDVPQLGNPTHVKALRTLITEHKLDVLVLDPTYLMMMGLGQDAGNLFIVGSFLKSIGDLAQETGCTPLLCHHLKKSVADPYEPAELENIAWAGFQEFARQWVLLNRRVKYDPDNGGHHELWMSVGGSAGHSGLWGLNVDEGTRQDDGGRRWEVEVTSASDAYSQRAEEEQSAAEQRKRRQRDAKLQRQREAVLEVLEGCPNGETPRAIREHAGIGAPAIQGVLDALVEEGEVVACKVQKNKREERAYRLVNSGGLGGP